MPSYPVIYTTAAGPQYSRFTLEDDSELGPQVAQVAEELRIRGEIIAGGPDDELAVFSSGVELDTTQTLRDLGVGARQQIELRMRPRPVRSHTVLAESYLPKASYAATLLGASAGALAWAAGLLLTDLNWLLRSYSALDLAFATLFGSLVGSVLLAYEALRRFRPVLPQALLGLMAGGAAAALGAFGGIALHALAGDAPAFRRALLDRVLAWALTGLLGGSALGVLAHKRALSRVGLASVLSLIGGALAGIVFNFPGPSALWQGVACALLGGTLGYGITGLQLASFSALVEVEAINRRSVGLVRARGQALLANVPMQLHALTRTVSGPGSATIMFDGQRVLLQPGAGQARTPSQQVRVGGEPVTAAILLGDGEAIDVGTTRFRLHVVAGGPG